MNHTIWLDDYDSMYLVKGTNREFSHYALFFNLLFYLRPDFLIATCFQAHQ
jgi:hypothetical protein